MKRKVAILGCLLLGTLFLASSGLLEPRSAFAFCDASVSGDDCQLQDDGGTGGGTGGGGWTDPCTVVGCVTMVICGHPGQYECWCFYSCNSGSTTKRTPGICPGGAPLYSPC